jgi:hypothetical protein
MIPMPPIIVELARDRELAGRDMQIWIVAVPRLEFVDFRPLSLKDIAQEFASDVSLPSIHRALLRLVERGYLERADARSSRHVHRYRIPLARVYPRRL